ncbi:hypothetical protein ACNTMW_30955 [Planosporangium sp. 12N6]|uniref:hypothetical protein n=1 Tax=Planosporangium spinosum TaxID=3402278 RepID=UPI003CE8C391
MGGALMACIPGIDPDCNPIGDLITNSAKSFLETIAKETATAAAQTFKTLITSWLAVPTNGVTTDSGPVAYLRGYTHWLVGLIAVASLLISAIRLALTRNGREVGQLGRGLATMVLLSAAGVPAVQILTSWGDHDYSPWILNKAADADLGGRLLALAPEGAFAALSPIVVIGVGTVLFLGTIVQIMLLLARDAGLILLAGLLPVAAATGISGGGRAMRDRYVTWLLAFILYKPVAATVYAAALWMLGKGQDLSTLLSGCMTVAIAIVALPALMRLIAPPVATLSGGEGGGAALAAGAAFGQVATGAVELGSTMRGRSSGGSGSGSGGPQMATGSGPTPPGTSPAPAGSATQPAGSPAAAAGGGTAAGTSSAAGTAGTAAGTGGAAAGSGGAAAAAGGGATAGAAAAGPVGAGVVAAAQVAKVGPAVVRKVGETGASGAGGDQQ